MDIALYLRILPPNLGPYLSVSDQTHVAHSWCQKYSYKITKEYCEQNGGAPDDKRPAFRNMMHDAVIGRAPFQILIVHDIAHFFIDPLQAAAYHKKLQQNSIDMVFMREQTDPSYAAEVKKHNDLMAGTLPEITDDFADAVISSVAAHKHDANPFDHMSASDFDGYVSNGLWIP